MSGASVVTTKSQCRTFMRSAFATTPVSMSSPGVQSECRSYSARNAEVRPMKHAPEVSHGRMCRPSIAIRYSTCCSLVTRLVVFSTSHLTEHRSAPEASTAATASGSPSPRRVSASSRSAIVVVTSASACVSSVAGSGSFIR